MVSAGTRASVSDVLKSVGKAVRVSPNEVSFVSTQSLKDIYGSPVGRSAFTKGELYDVISAGFDSGDIGTERNPQVHARMKRSLLGAFSTKSLREQESILHECIDKFIIAIGVKGQLEQGIDMTEWFEMIAFDVTGEMTFGESFGCIEKGLLPQLSIVRSTTDLLDCTQESVTLGNKG